MRYDSSMEQYREDILLTVKQVFGRDINIINNYIPGYAVMPSLKDYLKNNYVNCGGTISDGLQCLCSQTKGLVISYTSPINNSGDKTLTLSWSQTAKFIMDNWDDIFHKPKTEKAAEAKPTYKDVFLEHYPDFDVSRFEEFIEKACIEFYFGTSSPCDLECNSHWNSECLHEWRNDIHYDDLERVKEYLVSANVSEEKAEDNAPEPPAASEIVPANAEEIAGQFNYAVLSVEMGDYLKRKEQQLKNEYMNFTANCGAIFAEVQEKLAKDGHGTFIKWIEAMGFKAPTVYRMIDVHKFYLSQIEKDEKTVEIFNGLPRMLQYDISSKSAPPELVEQVLSGDITSHKDFIKMKKQLETTEMQLQTYQKNYMQMNKNFQEACEDNTELEKRIKELESRPRDVVIQPDEKVLEENAELKKQIDDMQSELMFANCKPAVDIKEFYETLHGAALSAIRDCEGFAKGHPECRARFKMFAEVIDDCIKEMEE